MESYVDRIDVSTASADPNRSEGNVPQITAPSKAPNMAPLTLVKAGMNTKAQLSIFDLEISKINPFSSTYPSNKPISLQPKSESVTTSGTPGVALNGRGGFVTLHVGVQRVKFIVDKKALCDHSVRVPMCRMVLAWNV